MAFSDHLLAMEIYFYSGFYYNRRESIVKDNFYLVLGKCVQ